MTKQLELFTPIIEFIYTEPAVYTVSTWELEDDLDDDDFGEGHWTVRAFQISEAELPRVMQAMHDEGWDDETILVERDGLLRVDEVLTP